MQVFDVVGGPRGVSSTDLRPLDEVAEVELGRSVDLGRVAGVTHDQLNQLRRDVRTSLNDVLFTRLHNMEEVVYTPWVLSAVHSTSQHGGCSIHSLGAFCCSLDFTPWVLSAVHSTSQHGGGSIHSLGAFCCSLGFTTWRR